MNYSLTRAFERGALGHGVFVPLWLVLVFFPQGMCVFAYCARTSARTGACVCVCVSGTLVRNPTQTYIQTPVRHTGMPSKLFHYITVTCVDKLTTAKVTLLLLLLILQLLLLLIVLLQ